MIVEISVVPIGVGDSLSRYVAEVLKVIGKKISGYRVTAMGTIFEVESFKELGEMLDEVVEKLTEMKVPRIYFVIKSDFRLKGTSMDYKVKKVEFLLKSKEKNEN